MVADLLRENKTAFWFLLTPPAGARTVRPPSSRREPSRRGRRPGAGAGTRAGPGGTHAVRQPGRVPVRLQGSPPQGAGWWRSSSSTRWSRRCRSPGRWSRAGWTSWSWRCGLRPRWRPWSASPPRSPRCSRASAPSSSRPRWSRPSGGAPPSWSRPAPTGGSSRAPAPAASPSPRASPSRRTSRPASSTAARLLKFFPAEPQGGLAYLKAIHAPYAHLGLEYIPLGGVSEANCRAYVADKTVIAVGGSWIAPRERIAAKDWKGDRGGGRPGRRRLPPGGARWLAW